MSDNRDGAPGPPNVGIDALLPDAMAARAERAGLEKTRLDVPSLVALAVLAGAFIAFGAAFALAVSADAGGQIPTGLGRLLAGLAFSLSVILVYVGGAELFTSNNLMVIALAAGRIRLVELLRAWALVYVGNLIGAVATVAMMLTAGLHLAGEGDVGLQALEATRHKIEQSFVQALFLAVLGNILVCLAVWLSYSARTTTDRILAIVPPITAFYALGLEHVVAAMFYFPYALALQLLDPWGFHAYAGVPVEAFPEVTVDAFLAHLVPVTLGNIVGGGVLVGAVYWFVYLHRRRQRG